jgi:hypothetical protein
MAATLGIKFKKRKLGCAMANSATTSTVDWDTLREEGLEHLQAMSGDLWTDYNIHDPGVTLLELLCYAITDLDGRISQDISDIVTENTATTTVEHYFSPGDVMTINPVTINDYRKLLIDLPGVKNAWLSAVNDSEPTLYYDKDNNALLYDYASGSERINLNGLYRVYIEKNEDVTDEAALKTAVLEKLHEHRNLCEDFVEVNIMEEQTISVFSDIQIDENADANEVMADIYYDLEEFISPGVKQYSLQRMLKKGKTIEEIFTGPQLENGFIDDDQLDSGTKRKELHTSDLIRIIMAHSEVKDVRNLYIANKLNPTVREKQEWALVVDSTKALVMEDFNASKLRMFKNETICPITGVTFKANLASLKEEAEREMFDDPAMDLTEPLGEIPDDLFDYTSIAYDLPATYGVSETGLPSTASTKRKALARQFRAYLLFFEQILVNYLKQLDSFKRLFAFRQDKTEVLKSYFSRLLPEEIWEEDFPEIAEMIEGDPTESLPFCATAFKRKNRILDHLLAQFNEKFADYALFSYKSSSTTVLSEDDRNIYYLKAKASFLENYPELSRDRNRAYNYRAASSGSVQTDGLKNLLAAKLGIDLTSEATSNSSASEEFFIVEHMLFRPDESSALDLICSERIEEDYQPDPYSYRLTFIIPKKVGRFSNSNFKELVYNTIKNETPAHICYTVLECTTTEMSEFTEIYNNFLTELINHKQGSSTLYNLYRGELMEFLGIGRPRLPVLHLDAQDVSGSETEIADGTYVTEWTDLSGNNHHALAKSTSTAPVYQKNDMGASLPSLKFTAKSALEISNALIADDFSVIVVFKTTVQDGKKTTYFPLIAGNQAASFTLGFNGNGDVVAGIGSETVALESTAASPHMAMFCRDETAGEIRLYLDGALEITQELTTNTSLTSEAVVIAPGVECDLSEVIVLDSVLTGSKKEKLEDYLSSKWGIPLSAVSSIAKPVLHLDANAITSFTKNATTNKISKWNDLSENGIAVFQGTTTLQPVYYTEGIGELPAVYFDNAALKISNNSTLFQSNFTIGIIYQAGAGEGRLLDGTTISESDKKSFAISLGTKGAFTVQAEKESVDLSATLDDTHLAIILGQVDGDKLDVTLWLDGKAYTDTEFTDVQAFSNCPADLAIGRSRAGKSSFTGKIGEIVIYDEALSVWKRQRLEDFLAEKWEVDISGVDSIATPILHLDAARQDCVLDASGVVVLDRDTKVYEWVDLSDSDNNALQSSSLRQPNYVTSGINGLGAIKFTQKETETDYYDDSLNIDRIIQDDFTVMVVFKPDATYYTTENLPDEIDSGTEWTEGVAVIDADCSGKYNDFGISFGKVGSKIIVMGGIGDRLTTDHTIKSGKLDFDSPHFITLTREKDSGEVKLYADGMLQAEADLRDNVKLNDSKTIKIGAFNSEGLPFHGLIGEIIIFDEVLTDSKRLQIEDYLCAKWQISVVTLPIDAEPIFHLDANATETITKDVDNYVSEWSDKNGLSELAAGQTVTKYRPQYIAKSNFGMPAIRFNNSFMEIVPDTDTFNDFTLAIVYYALSTGNLATDWNEAGLVDHYVEKSSTSDSDVGIAITRSSTLRARLCAQDTDAAASLNTPHIAICSRDMASGKMKIYLDGLLAATGNGVVGTSLTIDKFTIGAIQSSSETSKGYYHGDIAEVLLLNQTLSTDERQSLESYFSLKWGIDISGVNSIAKPVLHLDASAVATVLTGDESGKVFQWLDRNGLTTYAAQTISGQQPEYQKNIYNEQGALYFNPAKKTYLTVDPVVQDDFTVLIVYNAEKPTDSNQYMPVEYDSFTIIAGVDAKLSETIWNQLKNEGYINKDGKVLATFTPGEDGFTLSLTDDVISTIQKALVNKMNTILTACSNLNTAVSADAFESISGINQTLSQTIWDDLIDAGYLDNDGKVLQATYTTSINDFTVSVAKEAVINVILAQNWAPGVGLFDGNAAGEPGQLNMRDFGLLVGKDDKDDSKGKLTAGIGVPDDEDYQITQDAAFGTWHIGVLTRVKDTGVVRLYVDGTDPVEKKVARNISLKDAEQFTIGAENQGGNYLTGYIAEIIVLDEVPTDSELATIQSFLAKKWGVAL